MKLDWLKPLVRRPGPFVTVHIDATRADTRADREMRDRWQGLRRDLLEQGCDETVLANLDDRVAEATGVGGRHGRILVATTEGVLLDRVLPVPPARDEAVCASEPALLGAARAGEEEVPHLLVEVDRSGANLTWSYGTGVPGQDVETTVEGGHDELRKVPTGGWSQRRFQSRAEDSWERNAAAVAAEIDRIAGEKHPEAVLVTGDVRAVALVREAVNPTHKELLVELSGGSRAEGVKTDVFESRVKEALDVVRARRREAVLDVFRQERGRAGAAVTGLADVVDALRRAQVRELVLDEATTLPGSPLADRRLHVGPDPLQLGLSADDLASLGVQDGEGDELRADIALVDAAVGSDAGITFAETGSVELVDGVGAILRYEDASTPDESLLTMGGDTHRQGRHRAVAR
ncbi:Vms1/Ankzf1 family peptidyl-tRNA hydrolase [Cellulomonas endophytica]|uniref:baeRF2 domain-containing protein n=1 Tax=Cellulomonas endophytica TaxID=2494735 RepID=UPI00101015C3|nr:Vms1/Ankzf1 family peptidyl-tRNA hydrolase [Cellulomonas endophytica]